MKYLVVESAIDDNKYYGETLHNSYLLYNVYTLDELSARFTFLPLSIDEYVAGDYIKVADDTVVFVLGDDYEDEV